MKLLAIVIASLLIALVAGSVPPCSSHSSCSCFLFTGNKRVTFAS